MVNFCCFCNLTVVNWLCLCLLGNHFWCTNPHYSWPTQLLKLLENRTQDTMPKRTRYNDQFHFFMLVWQCKFHLLSLSWSPARHLKSEFLIFLHRNFVCTKKYFGVQTILRCIHTTYLYEPWYNSISKVIKQKSHQAYKQNTETSKPCCSVRWHLHKAWFCNLSTQWCAWWQTHIRFFLTNSHPSLGNRGWTPYSTGGCVLTNQSVCFYFKTFTNP